MTARIQLSDDLLRQTLEARAAEGPAPAEVASAVARAVGRTPQVAVGPAFMLPWPGQRTVAALALGAALLIVANAGISQPPVRNLVVQSGGTLEPALDGGRYRSVAFQPAVTFTVPVGRWAPVMDMAAELRLRIIRLGESEADNGSLTVVRLANVMTGICGYKGSVAWAASDGPEAFLAWLRGQLPVGLGAGRPITVAGQPGFEATFRATPAQRQECDYGFLLTDVDGAAPVEIPFDERQVRLAIVEVSGSLVLVMTEGGRIHHLDDIAPDADQVVDSISFGRAP
jgi:hypothetical protein